MGAASSRIFLALWSSQEKSGTRDQHQCFTQNTQLMQGGMIVSAIIFTIYFGCAFVFIGSLALWQLNKEFKGVKTKKQRKDGGGEQ